MLASMPLCPCRAADAVLKGQVETIVSFHIQNTSSSKADRSTAPPVRGVGNGAVGRRVRSDREGGRGRMAPPGR